MAEISKEFQQKLREYGQSLHVSQRGIFFEFAEASKPEKFLIQLLRSDIMKAAKKDPPLDFDIFLDIATKPLEEPPMLKKVVNAFLVPVAIIVFSPILIRLVKKQLIWSSGDPEALLLSALLGSLLYSSK